MGFAPHEDDDKPYEHGEIIDSDEPVAQVEIDPPVNA